MKPQCSNAASDSRGADLKMPKNYHPSQMSASGWYIASYIQRIDPVAAYQNGDASHEPWAVWENRILVRASNPDEALRRTKEHLAGLEREYTNTDGVLLRDTVVGLTSLLPIYESLEDGNEIEWIDRTGETVMEMFNRVRDNSELEVFTVPDCAQTQSGEQDRADPPAVEPQSASSEKKNSKLASKVRPE